MPGAARFKPIRDPACSKPWTAVEDVDLATLGWVHEYDTQRLHHYLSDVPPIKFEAAFYATHGTDQHLVEIP